MQKRWLWILGVLIVVGAPVAWWLGSPLFIDDAVDEAFPFDLPTMAEAADMNPEMLEQTLDNVVSQVSQAGAMDDMTAESQAALEERMMMLATGLADTTMDDPLDDMMAGAGGEAAASEAAAGEPQEVARGSFMDADNFHRGEGTALVFAQGEQQVLRFEDFRVTNGPDLHVLLVENINARSHSELGSTLDLGQLKGNVGNQNYVIPEGTDLSQYAGVMIYCVPFSVTFATAEF
ncbi:MAG: DM13 domain-containing protein [Deinococcota bacterium]